MKLPKRTPWFPASVKPFRPGVYEIRFSDDKQWVMLREWTGIDWKTTDGRFTLFGWRGDQWRGLTRPA